MADLHQMLSATLGARYKDQRASLPDIVSPKYGKFGTRRLAAIDTIAIHHTAGPREQTPRQVYAFHTGPQRQWSGIGYHLLITGGVVHYVGDVGTGRACVGDLNPSVICVCMAGNYELEAVDAVDAGLLRDTVAVVQRWATATLGRGLAVKGHGEMKGQQTACPGRNLWPIVRQLAAGTVLTPDGPAPGAAMRQAVAQAHRDFGITLNPNAALQRAILAAGLIPTIREFRTVDGGVAYICQRAESPTGGGATIFYCQDGRWHDVRRMPA